jgi:hypothetical protein
VVERVKTTRGGKAWAIKCVDEEEQKIIAVRWSLVCKRESEKQLNQRLAEIKSGKAVVIFDDWLSFDKDFKEVNGLIEFLANDKISNQFKNSMVSMLGNTAKMCLKAIRLTPAIGYSPAPSFNDYRWDKPTVVMKPVDFICGQRDVVTNAIINITVLSQQSELNNTKIISELNKIRDAIRTMKNNIGSKKGKGSQWERYLSKEDVLLIDNYSNQLNQIINDFK